LAGARNAGQAQLADQTPTFPTGVELIAVDVGVFDAAGNPVRDLRPEDFEVRLGGTPRRLASAEFVSRTGLSTATPPLATVPFFSSNEGLAQGRLIVLAIDDGSIPAGRGRSAIRAAGTLLDRIGPGDQVALVTLPGPQPREDFT